MFQRLKGAIDRTIAEEQARQRAGLEATGPASTPGSAPRRSRSSSTAGTQSPARRPRPTKKASQDITSRDTNGEGTNPDPAVFEAAFVIDDMDDSTVPSRVATPSSADNETGAGISRRATPQPGAGAPLNGAADPLATGDNGEANKASVEPATAVGPAGAYVPSELPPDVRARLRKLEKLEKTYPELLRSYRIAHSRATSIEPFEKALKENTPLTSIKDPEALVEYLNQINLKGDMVMGELKRVTAEKDDYKKKAEEFNLALGVLKEEVAALKTAQPETALASKSGDTANATETGSTKTEDKSPTGAGAEGKNGENFFSYDDEIPQLQAEIRKKSEEAEQLQAEVKTLTDELSLAKENSAGLVESLENTARELSEAKDAVAVKASVETQLEARNMEISTLTERLDKAQTKLKDLEAQAEKAKSEAAATVKEKTTQLTTSTSRNKELETELKKAGEAKSSLDQKIKTLTSETQ